MGAGKGRRSVVPEEVVGYRCGPRGVEIPDRASMCGSVGVTEGLCANCRSGGRTEVGRTANWGS